jgi:hypothetical protein
MLAVYAARDPDPSLETAVAASCTLGTSRFMVFADRTSLADALVVPSEADAGVVVGYSPAGLRVNKQPVETAWGRGAGIAVVRLEDLASLLDSADDGPVGIECLPESWRGWPAGWDQHATARTFRYYEGGGE